MTLPLSWKWTIEWKMAPAYSGILWCTHATQFLYSGQETALSVYQQWILYCSIPFPISLERHNELSTRGCCFIVTGLIIIHAYISHSDHVCLQKGFVSRERFVSKENSLKKIIPYQIFRFFTSINIPHQEQEFIENFMSDNFGFSKFCQVKFIIDEEY